MSRYSVRKLLSNVRPIDRLETLMQLPEEFVYCFKTDRVRSKGTGLFQKDQLRIFRKPHVKEGKADKVISIFYAAACARTWAHDQQIKQRQEWLDRENRKVKRRLKRCEERQARFFEKGHQLIGRKLSKSTLSIHRFKMFSDKDSEYYREYISQYHVAQILGESLPKLFIA